MQSRYFVGSLLILGALGFLVTSSLKSGTLKSIPVAELRAADQKSENFVGQRLRMVGFVGPEKITKEQVQTEHGVISMHKFSVVEGKSTVQVSFTDALPDTFRNGGPVQVDGIYTRPGVMKADHVLTKCPSKYESEKKAGLKNDPNKSAAKGDAKTAPKL